MVIKKLIFEDAEEGKIGMKIRVKFVKNSKKNLLIIDDRTKKGFSEEPRNDS